jgi:hypothetical protein
MVPGKQEAVEGRVGENVRKKEGNKLFRPECDSYISSPSRGGGVNRERQKKIRFAPPPPPRS